MYRYLAFILIVTLCGCTPVAVQQATTPPAPAVPVKPQAPPPPPPPTLLTAEIDVDNLVITEKPLSVKMTKKIFAEGAALPKATMLDPLANWLDFLRRKPKSHWQVKVSADQNLTTNAKALAEARVKILKRLIERTGLDPVRFEFITSATTQNSIVFYLK